LGVQIHFMDDPRNQLHQFLRVPCERVAHWWLQNGRDHALRTHTRPCAPPSLFWTPIIRHSALTLLRAASLAARLKAAAGGQRACGNLTLTRRRDHGFSAEGFKMMYG
jgi:hypothetical protein